MVNIYFQEMHRSGLQHDCVVWRTGYVRRRRWSSGRKLSKEGMIDLMNKNCEHRGCTKQPSFGKPGTKEQQFCADASLKHKACSQRGCSKVASFVVAGSERLELCKEHPKDGMVFLNFYGEVRTPGLQHTPVVRCKKEAISRSSTLPTPRRG